MCGTSLRNTTVWKLRWNLLDSWEANFSRNGWTKWILGPICSFFSALKSIAYARHKTYLFQLREWRHKKNWVLVEGNSLLSLKKFLNLAVLNQRTKYNSLPCHNSTICLQTLQSKLTEGNKIISDRVQLNTMEVRTEPTLYDHVIAKPGRYTLSEFCRLLHRAKSKLSHDSTKRW
jgi:hypothetical protein